MLNPALCNSPEVDQWLFLKSRISEWLMTPTLVVLPLLALVFIPWIIPRLPWKRLWSGLGTVLLAIYWTATFPLTIAVEKQGLIAFIPPDTGKTADAIVVLGRGEEFRKSRVKVAAALWQSHRAPLIFASGAGDGSEIIELLKAEGVPDEALDEEHCSRTTKENALLTASLLKPKGVKQIVLVTDSPHMLRSLLTFRRLGFEVIPHTSPVPRLAPARAAMLMFYEYMGLVSYGLHGEFLPQQLAKTANPPLANLGP
ncbi:MAG: YdcF family protein [Stigonema ocellatum SAG 48.90 = DSM 106950]|nr:YdcF family protein [Stigonema ocellatum SAG 48.90 = DSM 106950]